MADELSVFDMAGAPGSFFTGKEVTSSTLHLRLPRGTWASVSNAKLLQVGSEWIRVTDIGDAARPDLLIQPYAAADTTLTVDTTEYIFADPGRGVTDTISTGGETMTVTEVLGTTRVAVTRSGATSWAGPGTQAGKFVDVPAGAAFYELLTVERGVLGTAPAAHGRGSRVTQLYRPADFVLTRDISRSRAVGVRVTYSDLSIAFGPNISTILPEWQSEAGAILGYASLPLPVGARVGIHNGTDPSPSVNPYTLYVAVTRWADGAGTPIVPTTRNWGFYGTLHPTPSTGSTFTSSDGPSPDVRISADGKTVEALTAGYYELEVAVTL